MVATPQTTPQFTLGGTVFGRNASQWNQYFAAKVDAEGGTADNLNLTGTLTLNGTSVVAVAGVVAPLALNNGTLTLSYNNAFGVDNTGKLELLAFISANGSGVINATAGAGTYYVDTTTISSTFNLPATPQLNDVYTVVDSGGNAAANNIVVSGNGHSINGQSTFTLNADYQQIRFVYNGTQWQAMPMYPKPTRPLFLQTQSVTVANTVAETTILGTGRGSLTLPANFLTVGRTLKFTVAGYHSAVSNPAIRVKVKLGATIVLDTGAGITSGTSTNAFVEVRGFLTCATTGAAGTVNAQGFYTEAGGGSNLFGMVNTAPITIDTTAAQTINITVQWGTASASDSWTATNVLIETEG